MDRTEVTPQSIVVVMGVTGSGKTMIGRALAERLGVVYAEADSFHPPANIAKMASGQALDDDDRYPWLAAIADWIRERIRAGEGGVVSCSALKYRYRNILREAHPGVWFLHLDAPRDLIIDRVARRHDHFMPVSLVDSQFEALEPLLPHEAGTVVDASGSPEEATRTALARLRAHQASARPWGLWYGTSVWVAAVVFLLVEVHRRRRKARREAVDRNVTV